VETRQPVGYYAITEETSERLLLSPPQARRRGWAIIFLGLALLFLILEVSILRSRPPLSEVLSGARTAADAFAALLPYLIFPLIAAGFLVGAALAWGWWSEIEFDAVNRRITRRQRLFLRTWRSTSLPFERVDEIRIVRIKSQYSLAYYHLFISSRGRIWAKIPGYRDEKQAKAVRRRLLRYIGLPDLWRM